MEYACNAVKILQKGEIIRQNIIWCFANMEICIIFASEFRDIAKSRCSKIKQNQHKLTEKL